MSTTNWSVLVPDAVAHARAGGRRAHNARRQFLAARRRAEVVRLIAVRGLEYGTQTEIARALGVHRSTICRDLREVFGHMKPESKEAR
jgi:DNA invertase Pin-like site-specific DNA recombinase